MQIEKCALAILVAGCIVVSAHFFISLLSRHIGKLKLRHHQGTGCIDTFRNRML
jgi:hypothetical protein